MARHLMIATICLETGLLLGSGVVIGQLWVRSADAEKRAEETGSQWQASQVKLEQAQRQIDRLTADGRSFAEQLATAESLSARQQEELERVRLSVTTLEAQNESLLSN